MTFHSVGKFIIPTDQFLHGSSCRRQVAAPYNVEWLRKLVIRGTQYPGACEAWGEIPKKNGGYKSYDGKIILKWRFEWEKH